MHRHRYYLGDTFVVEHAPDGPPRGTAIVICPPLGYEDTCAYRPLRVLADGLCGAGHAVLRLDWPGLGDSADGSMDAQVAAAARARDSLLARGFSRIVGIGVRAGGLLALRAFDDLVLWGTPANGRAYLREERAFHKMAARAFGEGPPPPEGMVEAGGFLHDAAPVGELDGTPPTGTLDLGRDGIGDLLEDPYRSEMNQDILLKIVGHVSTTHTIEARPHTGAPTLSGEGWIERPWVVDGLSGILCEPTRPASDAWTLFFNAGGVRRSGPNRLWTRAARALAALGRPSLRLDVKDVGDSDGASTPHRDLEEMYSEASIADAVRAWDDIRARGATEIDAVGLCSGAFMGVQVAERRPVRNALLFNCLAFVWDDDARTNGVTSQIGRSLLDARRWKRLLTGRIDARSLATAVIGRARLYADETVGRLRGEPPDDSVARILKSVALRGTRLHLVSSEGDPSVDYLARHVPLQYRPRQTVLPGVDHTIRPVWAHRRVIDLIIGIAE